MIDIKYLLLLYVIYLITLLLPILFAKLQYWYSFSDTDTAKFNVKTFLHGEIVVSSIYEVIYAITGIITLANIYKGWLNMQISITNAIFVAAAINTIVLIVSIIVLISYKAKHKPNNTDKKVSE